MVWIAFYIWSVSSEVIVKLILFCLIYINLCFVHSATWTTLCLLDFPLEWIHTFVNNHCFWFPLSLWHAIFFCLVSIYLWQGRKKDFLDLCKLQLVVLQKQSSILKIFLNLCISKVDLKLHYPVKFSFLLFIKILSTQLFRKSSFPIIITFEIIKHDFSG